MARQKNFPVPVNLNQIQSGRDLLLQELRFPCLRITWQVYVLK